MPKFTSADLQKRDAWIRDYLGKNDGATLDATKAAFDAAHRGQPGVSIKRIMRLRRGAGGKIGTRRQPAAQVKTGTGTKTQGRAADPRVAVRQAKELLARAGYIDIKIMATLVQRTRVEL